MGEVEKILLSINNDKPPGIKDVDGKLLRTVADRITTPVCNIFNQSPEECVYWTQKSSVLLVIEALVLSHLDYCPVIWSNAVKKDLEKLQLAQNRALNCPWRTNINNMHARPSWLRVDSR